MHILGSIGREGRRRVCEFQVLSHMSTIHDSPRSPSTQRDGRHFLNDLWRPSAPSTRAARRWKSVNDDKNECWTSSSCHERVHGSCATGCISRSPISENQLNNECVCNQSLKCLGYETNVYILTYSCSIIRYSYYKSRRPNTHVLPFYVDKLKIKMIALKKVKYRTLHGARTHDHTLSSFDSSARVWTPATVVFS